MDRKWLRLISVLFLTIAPLVLLPLALFGASGATNSSAPPRPATAPGKPGVVPVVTSKVLVYDDDWQHSPTGPERALTALGIPYTMTGDPGTFVTNLTLQEWDLVIFANEYYGIDPTTLDALQSYLAASKDHKAIVQSWQAGSYPSHPVWATLGIAAPQDLYTYAPLGWWYVYHPLFNLPNAVPELDQFNGTGAVVYGASCTLTGSAGPGLGGFGGAPDPSMAGIVLSPDNRTIYKGLLDFCNDQDANANGKWDVQEWWENAIKTLYPRTWRVLVLFADDYPILQDINNLALYPDTPTISTFNGKTGTPTLGELKTYDVVLVWSNAHFSDASLVGDRLADYVDAGGRVVCSAFSSTSTWNITGRFLSGGYVPFNPGPVLLSASTLGTYTAAHRIMWGVSYLSGYWRQSVSLSTGATLVASWTDGQPLVATKGRVVSINVYVGSLGVNDTAGDTTTLFHNAIAYLMSPKVLVARAHVTPIGANLAALRNMGDVALVDEMDVTAMTPSVDQLKAYDVVMAYGDDDYANNLLMGNNLADFVDAGGGVILAPFDWQTGPNLAGRIMGPDYTPFSSGAIDLYSYSALGNYNPVHPLMQGVAELTGYYRDKVALNPGASLVASWADGYGLVATQGHVTAVNAYYGGALTFPTGGDATALIHNVAGNLFYLNAVTSASAYTGSADLTVNFKCTVGGSAPPYTFAWGLGGMAVSSDQNPTYTYTEAGSYDVTLTVTDALGRTAQARPFTIVVDPHLSISPSTVPTSGSAPLPVAFAANASGGTPPYTYVWNWDDGSPNSADPSPTHTYLAEGTFTPLLTVHDSAGHSAYWPGVPITVGPPLAVSTSAFPTSGSAPLPVALTSAPSGGTPPYTYDWNFGDGTAHGTAQNPSHTFSSQGSFLVVLTVGDSQSHSALATPITITVGEGLSVTASPNITSGSAPLNVSFSSSTSGGTPPFTYDWNFGDSTTHGTTPNPSHIFSSAGTFTVNLTVTDSASHTASATPITITVTASLTASASANPTSGSAPMAVTFTGGASGGTGPYSYGWTFGDGTGTNLQNPSHTYAAQGTYTATLTVTDGASHTASATPISITVSAALSVGALASPTSGSAPLTVSFTGTVSGGTAPYTYDWNYGDGTTHGTTQNPTHAYGSAGTFSAVLTVTDNASPSHHTVSSSAITITVTPPLSASASATPTTGSAPMPVVFTGTPSGGTAPYTYDWNYGDGTAHGTGQSPSHTYTTQGTYTATLTVTDSASHTASATPLTITVTAPLSASATATPTSGSVPLTVSFGTTVSGGTAPYTYDWNYGDGSAHGNTQAPSHTYTTVGTYTATVTVTDSAPSHHAVTGSVTVTVKPPPPVITLMKKVTPPFTIVVTGSNLQSGIQVYINGTRWSGVQWKNAGKIKLTGGASLKAAVPKGVTTTFRFVNPDTGESTTFWMW
jgi:PKD repeat protein